MILLECWISIQTILNIIFLTTKHKYAPMWCLYNEFCWTGFILYTEQYGLFIMNIILMIMWCRMIIKWRAC
jgi:hypothetical protein